MATALPRVITRTNPKADDIQVVDNCLYRNDAFTLRFQDGSVPMYGVRNGVFEEDLLLVLIDRARLAGNKPLVAMLTSALASIVPADVMASIEPTTPDHVLAASEAEHQGESAPE